MQFLGYQFEILLSEDDILSFFLQKNRLDEEYMTIREKYMNNRRRYRVIFILLLLLGALIIITNVNLGAMDISISQVTKIVIAKTVGQTQQIKDIPDNVVAVVWEIRLPRILCGFFVGMGLSVAGVIFQGILQNPLADPYTLGVSTGAAFGASIAILLNLLYSYVIPTSLAALVMAFLTLIAVIGVAKSGGGMKSSNLIIAGIIISSILSSGLTFMKMIAGENVSAIVFWLMGSLSSKSWDDVKLVSSVVVLTSVLAYVFANDLNIMTMGEKNAKTLGINASALRMFYLILGSLITAVCVSTCGVIGFIGLVVPHILRFWFTSDNRVLIMLSSVTGGILLLLADSASRVMSGSEIPVGVITTLLGGPFFIYIFTKRRKGGLSHGE